MRLSKNGLPMPDPVLPIKEPKDEFDRAMNDYYMHFGVFYPYAVGLGYPADTDEENIKIIRECIAINKPLEFEPDYDPDCEY